MAVVTPSVTRKLQVKEGRASSKSFVYARRRWNSNHEGRDRRMTKVLRFGSASTLNEVLNEKELDSFAQLALRLADAAAAVTVSSFKSSSFMKNIDECVESKSDNSPVTNVDRDAELAIRKIIDEVAPQHGIFGEEFGMKAASPTCKFTWIIDPIDGTKSFITGKPLFTTLISLLYDSVPVIGVIDQPVLKERWIGVKGRKTTLNGKAVATRSRNRLSDCYLYATSPHMFTSGEEGSMIRFDRLRNKCKIALYGCDAYAYALLASGCCDIVAEADLKPYDYLPLVPVIEGAGGVITDWRGQPLTLKATVEMKPLEVVAVGDKSMLTEALKELKCK